MFTPVIDTHAHIVPPDMVKILRRDGARYGVEFSGTEDAPRVQLAGGKVKPFPKFLQRTDERLAAMDRQGVDMQVISGWIDFSGYTMPPELGAKFSELQNEHIAAAVAANPDRYTGAANMPLQDPKTAIRMLERAVREQGFKAIQLSTYVGPGRFLDDAALDPFWQAAQEMKVFVLFHPYDEQPPQGLGDFFLHNCIGYPLQTTIAVMRMMFSGVFARFPDLMVRLPHAGGFLPYQIDRFRHAADHRPEPRAERLQGRSARRVQAALFRHAGFHAASAALPGGFGRHGAHRARQRLPVRDERSRSGGDREGGAAAKGPRRRARRNGAADPVSQSEMRLQRPAAQAAGADRLTVTSS